MWNTLYDLEVAEAHWHELHAEAAHERLAREALKERTVVGQRPSFSRLLERLRRQRSSHTDPRKN